MKTLPTKLKLDENFWSLVDKINEILDFLQPEESNKFKDVSSTDSQRHKMMQDSKPEEEEKVNYVDSRTPEERERDSKINYTTTFATSKNYLGMGATSSPGWIKGMEKATGKDFTSKDLVSKLKSRIEGMKEKSYENYCCDPCVDKVFDDVLNLLEEPME